MDKYTFSFSNLRNRLVIERFSPLSLSVTVRGKEDTEFHFSKKRAEELVLKLHDTITTGKVCSFHFNKTQTSIGGWLQLERPSPNKEEYHLTIGGETKVFLEVLGISRKQIKKIIKVMKEVYKIG